MAANVQYKSEASWTADNPTLSLGQVAVSSGSGLVKVGDGSTAWVSLPYQPQPLGNLLKEYATTGADTGLKAVLGLGVITAAGLALIDDATAAAQRVTLSVAKTNVSASSAPGVTDDVDAGYIPGDLWLRVSTAKLYVCSVNTSGAATWNILN
jgi:hypothetical protein